MRRRSVPLSVLLVSVSVLLMGASLVSAQDAPAPSSTISMLGYGEASAPAESATIQLTVSGDPYGPPPVPRPGATPGAEEREAIQPIIAALVDAGLNEEELEILVGPFLGETFSAYGPALAVLRFSLETPDLARISELVDAATSGAADEGLLIGAIGGLYKVADFEALEREARDSAIAHARANADVQAELLGVEIGEVSGSQDIPAEIASSPVYYEAIPADQGCSPFAGTGPSTRLALIDPTEEPMVTVRMQVQLSFEIAEYDGATPES